MAGQFPRYAARTGPYRVVAANLPAEHARALRSYCARESIPIQAVLKALVAEWLAVNAPVNAPQVAAARQPERSAEPYAAIPQSAKKRENTGRNEPIATLQKIDAERSAAKKTGRAFTD
jgi:hypothetical protein